MTVTISVERYDKLQAKLLSLEEQVNAHKQGKVWLGNSHFMGKCYKRLWLPSEVVEQLNTELANRVKQLEFAQAPLIIEEKRTGWWWKL